MKNDRLSAMRDVVKQEMKANPAKWAGIAAGAGFALGMIGRILRHRMSSPIPHVIIVEN